MIGKILKLDSKELEESLFLLESAISQIFNKQSSKLSYEELYRNVYYLVLNRFGEKAYTQTKVFLEKNIKIKYDNFNEAINEKNLSDLLLSWREINEMIKVANSICLYLHQRFIKVKKLPNIQEIGKKLFIKHFMNSEGIVYKKMMKDLMEGFLKDRKSEIVDKVTMTGITTLMV